MTEPYQTQPPAAPYAGYALPAYPAYPQAAAYGGYAQAPYQPVQAPPAVYYGPPAAYCYPAAAPAFTPEGAGQDPRRKGSARDVNRMTLLCFAQLALSAGWGYVFGILFVLAGIDIFAQDSLALSVMTGAAMVLSTGLAPFLFFAAGRRRTEDYLKFRKVGFFPGLLCVLAGLALVLLANIPAAMLQDALGGVGYEPSTVGTSAEAGSWLGFLADFTTIAVLGPMLEEIMSRGIILTTLRRYGIGFAVVASGLLFGLNHLDLSTALAATLAGIVMGAVYARTNNLWLTVWIHMLNNAVAVIGQYGALLCPGDPDLVGEALYLAALGLGLISLILVLTWKRGIFMTRRSPGYDGPAQPFTAGQSLSAMARAPMLWVFLAVVGAYFALMVV